MVAAIVVALAAFVFYAPTMHDYFMQDDFGVVGLFSQRSLAYFPRWFVAPWTEDIWGYVPDEIRPFPAASYVIASWFGATAPEPNHVLNIALHAANGVLVMWIAEAAAGLSLVPAAFAGAVFVLLPIQAESVAWVTGRVDSLPTFFYFASFLLYVRSVPLRPDTTNDPSVRRQGDYWWSVALFFAALFSKQNTITMVPALVLFDWLVARRPTEVSWRWLRPYVPYILLTIGFLDMRCSTRSRARASSAHSGCTNSCPTAPDISSVWSSAAKASGTGCGRTQCGLRCSRSWLPFVRVFGAPRSISGWSG
jgi:hypothetical protein